MENTIVSGNRRTFRAALFGVAMLASGGTALAATTAPTVAPLRFEYTVTDANGSTKTLENKITTAYEANRLAVDKDGNLYATDPVSNTVSVFNTNGRLVKQINLNRAYAVGVDKDGFKYVGGSLNGGVSIFVFDGNDKAKIKLGSDWGQPTGIAFAYNSIDGIDYTDVYVADASLNLVRRKTLKHVVDAEGKLTKEEIIEKAKDYGPYGGKMYAEETIGTTTYKRTRHKMTSPQGIAVDEKNGLLYLSIKEIIEVLKPFCGTDSSFTYGSTTDPSQNQNCTVDIEESWNKYSNVGVPRSLTDPTIVTTPTDSTYKYWNSLTQSDLTTTAVEYRSILYHVLVIDLKTADLKRKITIGDSTLCFAENGVALDEKGRLYVGLMGISSCGGAKVYDVSEINDLSKTPPVLSVSGFAAGLYRDVAFSPNSDPLKGRLFVTTGDSKTVSSYSIDGGTNPANTVPTAPKLLEPVGLNGSVAVVNTSTPILKIENATDLEKDPLTYAYEVYEINKDTKAIIGNPITPLSMFAEGKENGGTEDNPIYITSMTISSDLKEESLYSWRARSFDGQYDKWSGDATFCVDAANSDPGQPAVIKPLDKATVSPFASTLSWYPSTDSDCSNDKVEYEVIVSDSQGNLVKSFFGLDATSIMVSDIPGLISGNTYTWKVRAVDSRGGKSGYGEGSFVYKTSVVRFESNLPGTKVYIDGNYGYLGRSLGTASFEVQDITPGSHFVAFIKVGYEPLYKFVDVVDPVVNDSAVTVSAGDGEWVTASRIRPSDTGVEIVRLNGGNAVPFVVDYNNDGLKDMIAGDKEGKVSLYLAQEQLQEDGTKKVVLIDSGAIQADGSDINAGSNAVPFVVDYNNDGRKDLLVGSGDGFIYLYENGGTDTLPIFASAGTLKDSSGGDIKVTNSAPVVVDYNNDGRKDLVVGGAGGALRRYENIGTDASPAFDTPVTIKADNSDLSAGINSNSRVFFTDWNSDGKKDMVVGGNTLNLFFNVGTDDAPVFVSIQGLQQWIKDKKRQRGNREFIPYVGYNLDLGDRTGGSGGASPFIVDWDGTSARDVIVGNGSGGVVTYITE